MVQCHLLGMFLLKISLQATFRKKIGIRRSSVYFFIFGSSYEEGKQKRMHSLKHSKILLRFVCIFIAEVHQFKLRF